MDSACTLSSRYSIWQWACPTPPHVRLGKVLLPRSGCHISAAKAPGRHGGCARILIGACVCIHRCRRMTNLCCRFAPFDSGTRPMRSQRCLLSRYSPPPTIARISHTAVLWKYPSQRDIDARQCLPQRQRRLSERREPLLALSWRNWKFLNRFCASSPRSLSI